MGEEHISKIVYFQKAYLIMIKNCSEIKKLFQTLFLIKSSGFEIKIVIWCLELKYRRY